MDTVVETRHRENVTLRRGGDVPQWRYLDVVDTYHWDVLVTYHWDIVGRFIWGFFESSWRRTDGTSSLRSLESSSQHPNKTSWRRTTQTSWRRSTETSLGVSFETCLRRRWDVQRDAVTTSTRRLIVGWDITLILLLTNYGKLFWNLCIKSLNHFENLREPS